MKYDLMRAHFNEARRVTAAPDDTSLDLFGLARTLWRGRLWIVLAAAALGALGWSYATHLAVPHYTARATIALENRQASVIDLQNVVSGLSGDQATINTEVEVLRSRNLFGQLVDELGLMSDPEFNPFLAPGAGGGTGRTRDVTISRVLEAVSITNLRSSYVFTITATTRDPEKSAQIANTLGEIYIADQLRVKSEAMATATAWLSERVDGLKRDLQAAEAEVQSFAAQTDLVSPEALEALNRQIKDTRDRVGDLRAERDDLRSRLARLEAAASGNDRSELTAVFKDPGLSRLAQRLDDAAAIARFDARVVALMELVRADHDRTAAQLDTLGAALGALEASYASQSADLVTLEQLEREAQALRAIYQHFLTRLQETSVQQGIQQPDSRMLSAAVRPTSPSAPNVGRVTALTVLLGLVLGAGLVLLREVLHKGFRTAEEVERDTGLTVMGQLPKVPTHRRKSVVKYLVDKPTSAAAEAVRNLRTSVLMSSVDRPPQVILSTSSLSGEGKTTTAIALAQNFAGLGKSVLLIEGDIRRRVFSEYFDVEHRNGLLSILSGAAEFEDVVQRNDLIGVDVLLGEKSDTNAADVFSSDRFGDFMTDMRTRYDIIIIDTPPVLLVPDSRIIAHVTDAILFTVKWDATSRAQVREAVRQFAMAGVAISGAVLNLIDPKGMARYGHSGSHGAYAAYGHNKYDTN